MIQSPSIAPAPAFVQTIRKAIGYWKQETADLSLHNMMALDKERRNLFQVIQFGAQLEETWQDTADIVCQIHDFVNQMGYWPDLAPLLEQFIAACQETYPELKFKLLISLGRQQQHVGQTRKSLNLHKEAELLAWTLNDQVLVAKAKWATSETCILSRDYHQARIHSAEAYAFFKADGSDPQWIADTSHVLGVSMWGESDHDEAVTYLIEAIAIYRELAMERPLVRSLIALGNAYRDKSEFAQAQLCYEESEQLLDKSFFQRDRIMHLINWGYCYFLQQLWEPAYELFQEAHQLTAQRPADIIFRAVLVNNLGNTCFQLGWLDQAEHYLEQAIHLRCQLEDEVRLANSKGTLGQVWAARGDFDRADTLYSEAIALASQHDDDYARRLVEEFTREKVRLGEENKKGRLGTQPSLGEPVT